jgi:hypothetical protein
MSGTAVCAVAAAAVVIITSAANETDFNMA